MQTRKVLFPVDVPDSVFCKNGEDECDYFIDGGCYLHDDEFPIPDTKNKDRFYKPEACRALCWAVTLERR